MQNGFAWRNKIIPILDNQFLPVFRPAAIPSDILMEEMRVGNNSGIESDFKRVVGGHPLIIFGDLLFSLLDINRGTTWQGVLTRSFP